MQKSWLAVLAIAGFALLVACATGPKFDTVQSQIAPVPPGKARIFFYRSTSLGAAIQPDIKLNGTVVGKAEPNGVFYVDRDPGNMEVITGSEVDKKLTFTAGPGETRYVRAAVGLGIVVWRIIPELVSEAEARKEIADLAYIGAPENVRK
jgi:uncharacterized protein DUF2846